MNKRLHRGSSIARDYIEPLIRSHMMKERTPRLSNTLQAAARVLAMRMIQSRTHGSRLCWSGHLYPTLPSLRAWIDSEKPAGPGPPNQVAWLAINTFGLPTPTLERRVSVPTGSHTTISGGSQCAFTSYLECRLLQKWRSKALSRPCHRLTVIRSWPRPCA